MSRWLEAVWPHPRLGLTNASSPMPTDHRPQRHHQRIHPHVAGDGRHRAYSVRHGGTAAVLLSSRRRLPRRHLRAQRSSGTYALADPRLPREIFYTEVGFVPPSLAERDQNERWGTRETCSKANLSSAIWLVHVQRHESSLTEHAVTEGTGKTPQLGAIH